jgi:hypothetical protein
MEVSMSNKINFKALSYFLYKNAVSKEALSKIRMEVIDEVRQKIFKMLEEEKLSYLEAVYLIMKVLPEVLGANTQWENFYDSFKEKEELDLEWTERLEKYDKRKLIDFVKMVIFRKYNNNAEKIYEDFKIYFNETMDILKACEVSFGKVGSFLVAEYVSDFWANEIIKELEKDKSSILEKIKLKGDTDVNTQEINPN